MRNTYYNIELIAGIIDDRKNGLSTEEIENKYSVPSQTIYKILADNGLKTKRIDTSNMKSFLNVDDVKTIRRDNGKTERMYSVKCSCGFHKWIESYVAVRLYKNRRNYVCDKCSQSMDVKSTRMANQRIRKNNKTGYVGVFVDKKANGDPYGYITVINSKGKHLLKTRYKDDTLHETTMLQAVMDRDIFIREHNLPHRKNLTDNQLLAIMRRLAYKDIDKIAEGMNL